MRAIILAAGRGSRMQILTNDRPKCMVEFQGRPLLEYQLQAIRHAGIDEIAIVTGYKSALLAQYGLYEFHNDQWDNTNMVYSLHCAGEWLQAGECVVSYSDIFYQSSAISLLRDNNDPIAISFDPNWRAIWQKRFTNPLDDAESFQMDNHGFLTEIGQKTDNIDNIMGQYMGLLRFTPAGWQEFSNIWQSMPHYKQAHITGTLQTMIRQSSIPIRALAYHGQWGECDSPADLQNQNFVLL